MSPVYSTNNNYTGLIRTPTVNLNAYSSSDSNQSPPSSSFKVDAAIQTEYSENNSEYSFSNTLIFRQLEEKNKEVLRLNVELKAKYEKEKKKNLSSRETLKSLLIQKSRMERKHVNFKLNFKFFCLG